MEAGVTELYYNILLLVFDHAEMIICALCFVFLCRGFFRRRKTIWMIGITFLILLLIQYYIPVYMGIMAARAVSMIGSWLIMIGMEDRDSSRDVAKRLPIKVYLAFVFFSVCDLSSNISIELYKVYTEKIRDMLSTGVDITSPDAWKTYYLADCLTTLMLHTVEGILIFVFVWLINRAFYDKRSRYSWKEAGVLLVPSVAGFAVHLLRRAYEALFQEEMGREVTDFYVSHASIAVLLGVCYFAVLATMIAELYILQNLRRKQEEEKGRILLQSQMQDMQSHITEIERLYTGIRGMKHDLNNHMYVIKGLLEQDQYEEAGNYLETMQETMEALDFPIKTGNPITDVIINEKCRSAGQKEIVFQSDFYMMQDMGIDAFDISIILNNIIENAFEAVCKTNPPDRMVTLSSFRRKNTYLITVKNTYCGELYLGEDGLPESDKAERHLHGLGLKNVKSVVEKYYGTFAIEKEGGYVVVTVMLLTK